MNKTKEFMTFVEGIVDDPTLLRSIKKGYRACLESVSHDDGTWTFELEEDIEYSNEIAVKYFDVKKLVHEYKKETGINEITPEDITLATTFTAEFDFYSEPYMRATSESPEEGGIFEFDGENITYVALYLMIDGDQRAMIELDDKEKIANLDPMVITAFNKKIDQHRDEILEKVQSDAEDSAVSDAAESRYYREIDNYY
jgi:hypothetical protein